MQISGNKFELRRPFQSFLDIEAPSWTKVSDRLDSGLADLTNFFLCSIERKWIQLDLKAGRGFADKRSESGRGFDSRRVPSGFPFLSFLTLPLNHTECL